MGEADIEVKENTKESIKDAKENADDAQTNIKEERIKKIALSYYSRTDVRKAMLEFSKSREVVPRYFEGFGKRPDILNYDSDILELAKRGATSFHCSEELWSDPLQLSTGLPQEQLSNMREGWDLLIDIDCKYMEYSKKAAIAIVKALEKNNVRHIGVKFSGGKGFHIIVPWKAFPKTFSGNQTKDMFPEWPRLICQYLKEEARPFLEELMAGEDLKFLSRLRKGVRCEKCKNISQEREKVLFICPSCRTEMENITDAFQRKRIIRCPNCQKEMAESRKSAVYFCSNCRINSSTSPKNFKEAMIVEDIFEILGLDVILVSPRHLFRMPYSLHEKTSLASAVIDKNSINKFDIMDASPLKIAIRNFIPESDEGEAAQLLLQALDFKMHEKMHEKHDAKNQQAHDEKGKKEYKEIILKNLSPDLYPPSIKKMLEGMKSDGRKRALFILLNFFKSLKMPEEEMRVVVEEWNKKNYQPLQSGYIQSQLNWHSKQTPKLPPNFDKSHYREIGVTPTAEELSAKNPVSYTIRKFLSKNKPRQ